MPLFPHDATNSFPLKQVGVSKASKHHFLNACTYRVITCKIIKLIIIFFSCKVAKNGGISLQLKGFDFCGALESLRLCHGMSGTERRVVAEDRDMGKESLQLTELHGRFGHRYANIGVYMTTSGLI